MDPNELFGTAVAPLAAVRGYRFRRGASNDGRPAVLLPYVQRGTWDDFGVVEREEQERWAHAFLQEQGIAWQTRYPGELIFADDATRDRAWKAIGYAMRPPAAAPPSASASRAVVAGEARAVSDDLARRYGALLARVLGLTPTTFTRFHTDLRHEPEPPVRTEHWKSDDVERGPHFTLEAEALGGGVGVHGEVVTLGLRGTPRDGCGASAYARIDLRVGGTLSVTVTGVFDADDQAERFLRGG